MNSEESEAKNRFKCPHCPRIFYSKASHNERFDKHLLLHADERRLECEVCKDVFLFECRLREHMISHSDERPFNCNFCGASYKRGNDLKTHLRAYHRDITIDCKICSKSCTPSTIDNHGCDPYSHEVLETSVKLDPLNVDKVPSVEDIEKLVHTLPN